eukprot:TRINITY_DN19112_c0_g2_i1.p1 TRINITY_DN19112_c0_g2~~TRINITY_DN19112_c0_g2_i1.p1  ORF type:complete len:643 (-),score=130.17 TRINITY_DN19112_c0_g2_i1:295-2106(-)
MAGVLAVPEIRIKVNACGHLTEISPEGSASLTALLRELVSKLKVCNPASLQLADLAGLPIKTDEDLNSAVREGRQPLQAKLTIAALHEIEQKKKEGRMKEHDMVSLQWQIVIEQIASFQYDLTAIGGQLQSVKDDCTGLVNQFESQESLRRQQLFAALKEERADRENAQREFLQRLDAINDTIMGEKSAREVADYQLGKQIENSFAELNIERNGRSKDQAEVQRVLAALRHDLDAEAKNHVVDVARTSEILKRLEQGDKDHSIMEQQSAQRLQSAEADVEKLRVALAALDSSIHKQLSDTSKSFGRHVEEVERLTKDRSLGGSHEMTRLTKEHETSWQNLEGVVHRVREEYGKGHENLNERARMLELRCAALEKDHADHKAAQSSSEYGLLDKMHTTVTAVDSLAVDRQAAEVVLRTTSQRLDDLVRRVTNTEGILDSKVYEDHFRAQVDNVICAVQNVDMRLGQLDKDMNMRFSQEAAHREGLKTHLHGSIKTCLDKINVNDGGEMKSLGSMKTDVIRSVTPHNSQGSPSVVVVREARPLNGTGGSSSIRLSSPMPNRSEVQLRTSTSSYAWSNGAATPSNAGVAVPSGQNGNGMMMGNNVG